MVVYNSITYRDGERDMQRSGNIIHRTDHLFRALIGVSQAYHPQILAVFLLSTLIVYGSSLLLAQELGNALPLPADTSTIEINDLNFTSEDPEFVQSQWIDSEGRQPITYEEWKTQIAEPGLFSAEFIRGESAILRSAEQPTVICILVNADIYPDIEFYITRYVMELTGEGYQVELYTTTGGTPEELREFLRERHYAGIEGCIFIGDLPIAWYETYDCQGDGSIEQFPCDLFYMDLDGDFIDADGNGLYDDHIGDVAPNIWFGRLVASPLTYTGESEVELLQNYFEKNHLYRSDLRTLSDRALVYIDDDWSNADIEIIHNVSEVYDDWTLVNDRWETWDTDYENRLLQGYELVHLVVHSSAFQHVFKRPPSQLGYTQFSEIIAANPMAAFYILQACSNARFVEQNYMAGWYVFSQDHGLGAISSSNIGGIWADEYFYSPFAGKATIGESLFLWLCDRARGGFHTSGVCSFYGLTLIGDPTLTIGHQAYEIVQYDGESFDYRYRFPTFYPSQVNHFGVRFTAPVDCFLDEMHYKFIQCGLPTTRMYIWHSDGTFPTTIIDSLAMGKNRNFRFEIVFPAR